MLVDDPSGQTVAVHEGRVPASRAAKIYWAVCGIAGLVAMVFAGLYLTGPFYQNQLRADRLHNGTLHTEFATVNSTGDVTHNASGIPVAIQVKLLYRQFDGAPRISHIYWLPADFAKGDREQVTVQRGGQLYPVDDMYNGYIDAYWDSSDWGWLGWVIGVTAGFAVGLVMWGFGELVRWNKRRRRPTAQAATSG